jgi:hypothetical protein
MTTRQLLIRSSAHPASGTAVLTACTLLAIAGALASAKSDDSKAAPARPPQFGEAASSAIAPGAPAAKPTERLREGTRLTEIAGSFVAVGGDSITFSPAGSKDSYRVLENLNLQRISQQLDANRGQRQWIVNGIITEFRGANYLLVNKAVVQLQEGDLASGR